MDAFNAYLIGVGGQGIGCLGLIPDVTHAHFRSAMEDLLTGSLLEKNMALYNAKCGMIDQ